MTLLYSDPVFLEHETGQHPERAQRLAQVVAHLRRTGLDGQCTPAPVSPISIPRLLRVHGAGYVQKVSDFAAAGGGFIEEDTFVSSASHRVALHAAGAACDAVDRVLRGEETNALCLVRPPGHHALAEHAMGFCLYNNVALAASTAIEDHSLDRVLIVDWDVHHGNATQDTFWRDEQVGFFSIHRWPFYPGTGQAVETGSGPGLGATCNAPIEFGTSRDAYFDTFRLKLEHFAATVKPQLVLISAGFDSHRDDPVGSLGLETEDFDRLTSFACDIADAYADGRVVSVLEGGYNPGVLAGCVEVHLERLIERGRKHATR